MHVRFFLRTGCANQIDMVGVWASNVGAHTLNVAVVSLNAQGTERQTTFIS
jgi:hypothetical protein